MHKKLQLLYPLQNDILSVMRFISQKNIESIFVQNKGMTITAIRQRLVNYMNVADDKKYEKISTEMKMKMLAFLKTQLK